MTNLFDYISWRGDITFDKDPFNKLDALYFAQLSYMNLDDVVPEDFNNSITIRQLAKEYRKLPDLRERNNMGFLINEKTPNLLFEAASADRFKDVKVCGFRNIFSEKNVEQFAVVSFIIGKNVIISYRGTDDTIIGFQEDFEIAYKNQVPAQIDGLKYFEDIISAYPKYKFILVGHSKGGNIALNTAVMCLKKNRKKISVIYNFDGPGFPKEFYDKPEYKEIEQRLYSFYPQLSVVGMLFHHPKNYEIIQSSNFAIMQHDALSWNIMGCNFINKTDFTEECKIFTQSFNNWADKISMEERKHFVNCLFRLIKSTGYKTNLDIEKNALAASTRVIAAYAKMDKKEKDEFKEIFALLIDTVKSELPIFKIVSK